LDDKVKSGEERLLREIRAARKRVGAQVGARVAELRRNPDWFSELCFCLLTANYTAEGGMRIQKEAGDFSALSERQVRSLLKRCGHRFPNARAKYIRGARKHKRSLAALRKMRSDYERREWLVKNVRGLGYKEASHFLRNVGFMDVAIIDRHVVNVLAEYGIVKKPKTLTKKKYLAIEKKLRHLSEKTRIPLGELDFYIWWLKTGKILK